MVWKWNIHMKMMECVREKSLARCVRDEDEEERTNPKSRFPKKKLRRTHGRTRHDSRSTAEN